MCGHIEVEGRWVTRTNQCGASNPSYAPVLCLHVAHWQYETVTCGSCHWQSQEGPASGDAPSDRVSTAENCTISSCPWEGSHRPRHLLNGALYHNAAYRVYEHSGSRFLVTQVRHHIRGNGRLPASSYMLPLRLDDAVNYSCSRQTMSESFAMRSTASVFRRLSKLLFAGSSLLYVATLRLHFKTLCATIFLITFLLLHVCMRFTRADRICTKVDSLPPTPS